MFTFVIFFCVQRICFNFQKCNATFDTAGHHRGQKILFLWLLCPVKCRYIFIIYIFSTMLLLHHFIYEEEYHGSIFIYNCNANKEELVNIFLRDYCKYVVKAFVC